MSDIRECPCCHGKAIFVAPIPYARNFIPIGHIACKKCGLRTRSNTRGRVLKLWNRREAEKAQTAKAVPL